MKGTHSKLWQKLAMVLLAVGSLSVHAEKAPSPRTVKKVIDTKESLVEIQGKKFHKFEIQKEAFYVEALDSTQTNENLRVLCQQGSREFLPAQVHAGVKTGQRSAIVIEGLRQVCKDAENGRREISLDPAVFAGLQLQLGKEQNRKVIVTPVGITFRADW